MDISKYDMLSSASAVGIPPEAAKALWETLEQRNHRKSPTSSFSQLVYYFGALIVIGAMAWFFMLGWELFGGGGIFLIACIYALLFTLAGRALWKKSGLQIPGGLFFTLAVCMVPLAIFGMEFYTGLWMPAGESIPPAHLSVDANWLLMELGTILASLIALYFVPFPFLTAPLSAALWLMSIDLAPLWYGTANLAQNEYYWIALWFGLGMILISYLIDCRTKEDYSFWGYLFGLVAFWYSLTWLIEKNEGAWALFCLINIGLMLISVLIERRVFLIFGSVGVFFYFCHIAYEVFHDSMWFPFALSFLGIAVIFLGILYQRHAIALHSRMQSIVPERWRNALLPQKRK